MISSHYALTMKNKALECAEFGGERSGNQQWFLKQIHLFPAASDVRVDLAYSNTPAMLIYRFISQHPSRWPG